MTTQTAANTHPDDFTATRVALIVLVALSCADAILSAWLWSHGLMREINPVMVASLTRIGLGPTLAIKLSVTSLTVWTLLELRHEIADRLPRMIWVASAAYLLFGGAGLVLEIIGLMLSRDLGPLLGLADAGGVVRHARFPRPELQVDRRTRTVPAEDFGPDAGSINRARFDANPFATQAVRLLRRVIEDRHAGNAGARIGQ